QQPPGVEPGGQGPGAGPRLRGGGAPRRGRAGDRGGEVGLMAEPVQQPGRFGPFGGQYVPETLMPALEELDQAFREASADPAFESELDALNRDYGGRPTPLYHAERLSEHASVETW